MQIERIISLRQAVEHYSFTLAQFNELRHITHCTHKSPYNMLPSQLSNAQRKLYNVMPNSFDTIKTELVRAIFYNEGIDYLELRVFVLGELFHAIF